MRRVIPDFYRGVSVTQFDGFGHIDTIGRTDKKTDGEKTKKTSIGGYFFDPSYFKGRKSGAPGKKTPWAGR